ASSAWSSSAMACCSFSPIPKNAGAEPMPPKFPQPSPSREILSPVVPRRRYSIGVESVHANVSYCQRRCNIGPRMKTLFPLAMLLVLQQSSVVMDNARVRVYRTDAASLAGVEHGPGVIVYIDEKVADSRGRALWRDDVADRTS